ncbi:MAG: GldG family protein [Prosthecobacter sp.]|uniref:GldG family protein n=1 Tax=Prosthecobacter sp. TaxID=1965333 RepID=UPI0025DB696F|nr:GldG family protein [Prosthecobacter sp.]MCF7788257.1 GldG family protein [Prosthecobacter sp.]
MPDSEQNTPPASAEARPMPKRYGIGMNVALQLLLAFALFVGVNRLNYYHYWRWDLSASQDYTLSPATLKYLDSLSRDVQIYIVFARDSKVYGEVQSLLEEYNLYGRQRIKVRSIDPVHDIERAEQLKADTGLSLAQNGVLIRCGVNRRFITEEELVVREKGTSTNKQIIEFRGEDAISSALISVVEGRVRRFYYVVGKGSRSGLGESDSYNAVIDLGRQQNFEVIQVNLSEVAHIPTDTDGLLILGPRYDLTEREVVMLNNYWQSKRAGIFIMLDPGGETARLNAFLTANGVHPRGDRVLMAESTSTGPKKEFSVLGEFTKEVPFIHHLTSSAITLAGQTESLELLEENTSLKEQSISVKPLILAAPRYWGEKQFLEELPIVDEEDTLPPIYVAASIERGALGDETQRADTSRMVVVSNSTLLDKQTMLAVSRDFAAAGLNWLMNRESFIGIPAKSKHSYRIQLTTKQHELIFWITSITLPGIVLGFGFMVWASRRAA